MLTSPTARLPSPKVLITLGVQVVRVTRPKFNAQYTAAQVSTTRSVAMRHTPRRGGAGAAPPCFASAAMVSTSQRRCSAESQRAPFGSSVR